MINEEMTQTSNNHLSRGMFSTEGTNDEDRHITTEKFGPCHSTTSRPGETYGDSGVFVPTYFFGRYINVQSYSNQIMPTRYACPHLILKCSDGSWPEYFKRGESAMKFASHQDQHLTLFQIAKWRSCSKL